MTDSFRSHRSPLLDCIRFVAISMVIVYHVATVYAPEGLDWFALFFARHGAQGVDIFFPLSGYLISRFLIESEGAAAIRTFFLRRFFRIVPLYVVAVTAFLAAMLILGFEDHLIDRIWVTYLFLTAWFIGIEGHAAVPYTITWTLSVEEFAYICFGLFALLSRRRLVLFLLACAVLPTIARYWMVSEEIRGMYYLPLTRIDSIAIGGLVAWSLTRRGAGAVLVGLIALTAAVYGLSQAGSTVWAAVNYLYIPLCTAMVIVVSDKWLRGIGAGNPLIQACANIGFHSYFTYLFHYFNIYGLSLLMERGGIAPPPFWLFVVLAFALTHAQAMLSYRYFEGPLIRYGRSLERGEVRRTQRAATGAERPARQPGS